MSKPTKIMIVRHCEKPTNNSEPYGVTHDGEKDFESPTVRGWQRSGALVPLFAPTNGVLQDPRLLTPNVLYASKAVKHHSKIHSHSRRPIDTIKPLSQRLGLKINTDFTKEDYKAMVKNVLTEEGTVLISWEHELVPALSNHITGNKSTVPQDWPDDRFDLVWIFDLDLKTDRYTFSQVPQNLLSGDQPTVIS